jgi:hypothetical protein
MIEAGRFLPVDRRGRMAFVERTTKAAFGGRAYTVYVRCLHVPDTGGNQAESVNHNFISINGWLVECNSGLRETLSPKVRTTDLLQRRAACECGTISWSSFSSS